MGRVARATVRRSPTLFHVAKAVQAGAQGIQRTYWRLRRSGAIRRYLDGHDVKKLELGAGEHPLPGWLCTDIDPTLSRSPAAGGAPVVFLDATRRFPFADGTFDYVFSEHMVEHLSYDAARFMLAECRRVLRPQGVLRIATPDLERLLALYEHRRDPAPDETAYVTWVARTFFADPNRATAPFVLNNAFRAWGHQFLFDEETLRALLADAGFVKARRVAVGESQHVHLRGLERHACAVGDEAMTSFETLVLEAEKAS
jgi:predicted SAM-dependent methyltransferase